MASAWLIAAPTSHAQEVQASMLAMVQVVVARGDETVRGSGFVVAIDRPRGIVTVLTSSHVVRGGAKVHVRFAADTVAPLAPAEILNVDSENENSLAVLLVRGGVPPSAAPLEIAPAGTPRPRVGQAGLVLLGYPSMASTPLVSTASFSGPQQLLYVLDRGVEEGSSGGPVLVDGKVIGLVSSTTVQRTFFVPFQTIRTYLDGLNVALTTTPDAPAAPQGLTVPQGGGTASERLFHPDDLIPPAELQQARGNYSGGSPPPAGPPTMWRTSVLTGFSNATRPLHRFMMTSPTHWGEYDFGAQSTPRFAFREAGRTADFVTLWDDGRKLGIQLPIATPTALLNQDGAWRPQWPIERTITSFSSEIAGGYVGSCASQSADDGPETNLVVQNSSALHVALFWIAGPGDERFYQAIPPGGSVTQQSYVNHRWCLRSQDTGFEIAGFFATQRNARIQVR